MKRVRQRIWGSALLRMTLTLLVYSGVSARDASAQSTTPNSAINQFLLDWIEVYNAADSAGFERLQQRAPGVQLPRPAAARSGSGLTLERVLASDARHMEALLSGGDPASQRLVVLAAPTDTPERVARFTVVTIPSGRPLAELLVSSEQTQRVLDGVVRALREDYAVPELGARVGDSLRARAQGGAYQHIASGRYLADALTADLREISRDRHLRVDFSVPVLPIDFEAPPSAAQEEERRRQLRRANCTFRRAELVEGNIGIIKFNGFGAPKYCASTAAAAMAFVSDAEALIIDLRDNNGGDPEMVTLLSSYFVQSRTRLNTVFTRASGRTEDIWSYDTLTGRLPDSVPLYILTSSRTFSAGEALAYQLQMLKRAIIVGEVTGGGAHPSRPRRIDDHFAVVIPYARMINPVSGTDWEGIGVQPDVRVREADALETARRLAATRLAERR